MDAIKTVAAQNVVDSADASAGASEVVCSQLNLRLAQPADVPIVVELIRQLAVFEELLHECEATEDLLTTALFAEGHAPFKGPTAVLAEVSGDEGEGNEGRVLGEASAEEAKMEGWFREERITMGSGEKGLLKVSDPEKDAFASTMSKGRTVVGFILVFPNFSTFLSRAGIYVEDLFVRAPYSRMSIGTHLLSHIARICTRLKLGRMDWVVLEWNQKAIDFYTRKMGASIKGDWRICRLTGLALEAAGKEV